MLRTLGSQPYAAYAAYTAYTPYMDPVHHGMAMGPIHAGYMQYVFPVQHNVALGRYNVGPVQHSMVPACPVCLITGAMFVCLLSQKPGKQP